MIAGRGLLAAESLASEIRSRLVDEVSSLAGYVNNDRLVSVARRLLDATQSDMANVLADTETAAWVAGYHDASKRLPSWLDRAFTADRPPIDRGGVITIGADDPFVRFPLIENATESLLQRNILTRDQLDKLDTIAKQMAFTVAYEANTDTIDGLRTALADVTREGASLERYRQRVAEAVQASAIGPAHLETVYRTNIQAAFRDGRESLASHPVVSSVFPYQQYVATHDARTRPEHLAMETLGLNGTAVFRRDDPVWDMWTPPAGFNCRCGVMLLTVRQAADMGVKEAVIWNETGEPPARPEWRIDYVPQSTPGFGGRGRVIARAA